MRTRVIGTLVSLSLVTVLSAAPARAELLVNGSFEQPAITAGFQNFAAPSTEITGWAVTGGSVDLVRDTFHPSFQGSQSLDLAGTALGRIEQSFATNPGSTYTLAFVFSNNPRSSPTLTFEARVEVLGSGTLLDEMISHSGATQANMNYTPFAAVFVADSATTTLLFTALNRLNQGGIVLDSVSVQGDTAAVP